LVKSNFSVEEIDFFGEDWKSKLAPKLEKVQVILVADVVYDPDLTRQFFSSLRHVLDHSRNEVIVYFSIEKRNRVNDSGDISAPNFELFLDYLEKLTVDTGSKLIRINLDFEQRFKCYDRVEELFMWKLIREKPSKEISCKG
jgi:hypothetical protein